MVDIRRVYISVNWKALDLIKEKLVFPTKMIRLPQNVFQINHELGSGEWLSN